MNYSWTKYKKNTNPSELPDKQRAKSDEQRTLATNKKWRATSKK